MMRSAVKSAEVQADGALIVDLSKHCCNIKRLVGQKEAQKRRTIIVRQEQILLVAVGYARKGRDMEAGDVRYVLRR